MPKTTFWARLNDAGRMRDSGEMASRTLVATFSGGNLTCVREPDSGALHVIKMNEQGVPERVAAFAGQAFVGELSEASGEGESELSVYHVAGNSNVLPTAVIDRRVAQDAAPKPVKVSNLIRLSHDAASRPTRDMTRLKERGPILALQARNEALRSTWNREARR